MVAIFVPSTDVDDIRIPNHAMINYTLILHEMLLMGRCGPLLCPLIVPPGPLVMVQSHFFANKMGGTSYSQPVTGKSQPQSIRLKSSKAPVHLTHPLQQVIV